MESASLHDREVVIYIDGLSPLTTKLPLVEIPKRERVLRAGKSLGILWACAVGAAFIPMLHFILVPGFLLAGILFAANGYSDDQRIGDPKLTCLKCKSPLSLKDLADQFPKYLRCESCGAEHRLETKN